MSDKKRHHYVPVAYLNGFTDSDGKIYVFSKVKEKTLHQSPRNTALRRYYYSQPTPSGQQDNNALEDLFGSYETSWPEVVSWLENGADDNRFLEELLTFLALQMVRVPATRDAVEHSLAESVRQTANLLQRQGKLPTPPMGFENILDMIEISIDPHRSIHAMKPILDGFAKLIDRLGFMIIRNETGWPFLTSDNPVFWFDPSKSFDELLPNTVSPDGPVHLIFPITNRLLLVGTTAAKSDFSRYGLLKGNSYTEDQVMLTNEMIARFGYEAFFGSSSEWVFLAKEFQNHSPITKHETVPMAGGLALIQRRAFGQIKRKPKWKSQ